MARVRIGGWVIYHAYENPYRDRRISVCVRMFKYTLASYFYI